jgi:hypothetical protein
MPAGILRLRSNDEREQTRKARTRAQSPGGPSHSTQLGSDNAGSLEGSDASGAQRMDLLGHLGQAGNNAPSPNPTRDRGSAGGETPSLLLARLSPSQTKREEVVRETRPLTDGRRPAAQDGRRRGFPGRLQLTSSAHESSIAKCWYGMPGGISFCRHACTDPLNFSHGRPCMPSDFCVSGLRERMQSYIRPLCARSSRGP